jgi:hypoxanthine phosphoribosyltransferase
MPDSDYTLETILDESTIRAGVERLAADIRSRCGDTPLIAVVLMDGAKPFADLLLPQLPRVVETRYIKASSYQGTQSTGEVIIEGGSEPLPVGSSVLILDDVLDTGLTLQTITHKFLEAGVAQVLSAVAITKRGCQTTHYCADFSAFELGNDFLVGFGMDYDGALRELPFVAKLQFVSE